MKSVEIGKVQGYVAMTHHSFAQQDSSRDLLTVPALDLF